MPGLSFAIRVAEVLGGVAIFVVILIVVSAVIITVAEVVWRFALMPLVRYSWNRVVRLRDSVVSVFRRQSKKE